MKAHVLNVNGEKIRDIEVPKFFNETVREDIIAKAIEAKKRRQPYAPYVEAGKQHSASGVLLHARHVWKNQYGRGISRVPRKIMTRRGSQFNWVGAEVSGTRGGRRSHPPKILGMQKFKGINKKEEKIALMSALSATASSKEITRKYSRLNGMNIERLPFIVDDKITKLKMKELIVMLQKILGEKLFEVALQRKTIRAGRGKTRGRKYKTNEGLLIVVGSDELFKVSGIDVIRANEVGVADLADGRPGRLTIYTEKAIKELENKIEGKHEGENKK